MPRSRYGSLPANPFQAWASLSWKMSEMLFASALVIHHRSNRIAAAGGNPGPRDRKEFTRMVQEKHEAASESAQAMATQLAVMNMEMGSRMMEQMLNTGPRLMSAMFTPALFWSPQGQVRLMRQLSSGHGALSNHFSGAVARLASHGLKPVHARATGNASRLVYRPLRRSVGK